MRWPFAHFLFFLGILSLFTKAVSAPHPLVFHPGYRMNPLYTPPSLRGELVDMTFSPSSVFLLTSLGEIWEVSGAQSNLWRLFASGLRSPLGIEWMEDHHFLVLQPHEMTLVSDLDHDDVADSFRALSAGWPQVGPGFQGLEGPHRDSKDQFWISFLHLPDPQPSQLKFLYLPKSELETSKPSAGLPVLESSPPSFLFRHYDLLKHRELRYLFTAPPTGALANFSMHHFYQDLKSREIWRRVEDVRSQSAGASYHLFSRELPILVPSAGFSTDGACFIALKHEESLSIPTHALLQKIEQTEEVCFEVLQVEAISTGFRFHFSQPIMPGANTRLRWRKQSRVHSLAENQSLMAEGEVEFSAMSPSEDGSQIDVPLARIPPPGLYEFTWHGLSSIQGTPLYAPESFYRQDP